MEPFLLMIPCQDKDQEQDFVQGIFCTKWWLASILKTLNDAQTKKVFYSWQYETFWSRVQNPWDLKYFVPTPPHQQKVGRNFERCSWSERSKKMSRIKWTKCSHKKDLLYEELKNFVSWELLLPREMYRNCYFSTF